MLLDTYAPLKRVNKYKMKFKSKTWITLGLQKSMSMKNKLLKNSLIRKTLYQKRNFTLTTKNIEPYSPPL